MWLLRKKSNMMGWLVLLVLLVLLLYLFFESRQRTRQLNNRLKDISTGIRQ